MQIVFPRDVNAKHITCYQNIGSVGYTSLESGAIQNSATGLTR